MLSPETSNQKTSLALFCPATNRVKGYPFETPLPPASPLSGVGLCDQIKSLDWAARRAEFNHNEVAMAIFENLHRRCGICLRGAEEEFSVATLAGSKRSSRCPPYLTTGLFPRSP